MKKNLYIIKILYIIIMYLWALRLIVTRLYCWAFVGNIFWLKNLIEVFYKLPQDHFLISGFLVFFSVLVYTIDICIFKYLNLKKTLIYLIPVVMYIYLEICNLFSC